MIELRPYQQAALQAMHAALVQGLHPVVALPTGSGKSLLVAALAAQRPGRVLVVTHRRELLEQNATHLLRADDQADWGFYSAGLRQRETQSRVIFGGVASIYRRMSELQQAGQFGTVIVDECHLVAPRSQADTMYAQVFSACPVAQRIGLSATPYRLDDGPIWGTEGCWFDTLAYQIGLKELTPQYLAPLRGLLTAHGVDVTGVRIRHGEFVTSDLSQVACKEERVEGAMDELCAVASGRKSWLLFCVDVAHTRLVYEKLLARGITAAALTGNPQTSSASRDDILAAFRSQTIQALVNCEVATTGFDIAAIDVIDMLRPTESKTLCVQMLGRGTRQAVDKNDCLVIDHASNLWRHRPLDGIPVLETTPALEKALIERRKQAGNRTREWRHGTQASLDDPMAESEPVTLQVRKVFYKLEPSRKYPQCQNLIALYLVDGPKKWVRQWVTPEYPGGGKWYAQRWFERRGLPMPLTASEGKRFLESRRAETTPMALVVRPGKYSEILLEQFPERE